MKTVKISLSSKKWEEFCGDAFYSDKRKGVLIYTVTSGDDNGSVSVYVINGGKGINVTEPMSHIDTYPFHRTIKDAVDAYNKTAGFTGVRLEVTE